MTGSATRPFNASHRHVFGQSKQMIVSGQSIQQLGAATVAFRTDTTWHGDEGLPDEAIIETFLVDLDSGDLTALGSNTAWIERWSARASGMARCVLDAAKAQNLALIGPGYLTCSITPSHLLEGQPHVDDDQFVPGDGLGLVAISGQHVGPRVAVGALNADRTVAPGPVIFDDVTLASFTHRETAAVQGPADDITVFAQFGQLHAGPSSDDVTAPFRQLMVLRCSTSPDLD